VSYRLRFTADDVRLLKTERVFDGYFAIDRRTIQHRAFGGGWAEPVVREVFERGDAVGVLPYDPVSDTLILIEQFRAGALGDADSPWMLELIAGIVEAGEADEDVVHRESEEEAGCSLDALVPIASYYPSSGACSEHVRLFVGRAVSADAGAVRGLDSEGEDILVHRLAADEVLELLAAGRINNGHTLVALQWFALHRRDLRARWTQGAACSP
jgi:ADP-ribose pyrophosphatase